MNSSRKRRSGASPRASWTRRGAGGLAVLWLGFVVFLDIQYSLFPKTTIGGLKILVAALIIFALVRFIGKGTMRLWRMLNRDKNDGKDFARTPQTPS